MTTARPLVGIQDLATPDWALASQEASRSGMWKVLSSLPSAARLVLRLAWRASPWMTVVAAVLAVASGCATAFGLLATADVLTALLAGGPTPDRLTDALPAVLTVVSLFSARAVLEAAEGAVHAVLRARVHQTAQLELHEAVVGVDLIAFEDSEFLEILRQAQDDGVRNIETSVKAIADLAGAAIQLAAAVTATGLLHPLLAPLVVVTVLPEAWAATRAARLAHQSFLDMVAERRSQAIASELIIDRKTAAELRACTAGPALLTEYLRITALLTAENQRVEMARSKVQLLGRAARGVGTGAGFAVLGWMLYDGALPLALAGTAVVAMRMAASTLTRSVHVVNQLYENTLYIELFTALLEQARRRTRPPTDAQAPGDPEEFVLEQVEFSYPGQAEPALRDISLTIRKGQTIAFVGENGSGKTTLVKVLTGLYQPTAGRVRWNGTDLATVEADSAYEQIAVVLQEPARWPMSAHDNIRIGRLERADPDGLALTAAINASGADTVIDGLPAGGETVLSRQFSNGRDLSGGQWQRIGVARGLYRDAPILIADEPTAALDARAEQAVFESLRRLSDGGRTTLLITHRLANVRHADLIVVMENGRIVDHGDHGELIRRDGPYAELYNLQAAAYQPV
ncbi:ABC transporter ATP-binding protein [Kribbella koreensis]|uniref:ABC transporter ATP-binding protein n=1 Tax=Kribbella koreensis TaxID=57909 RepID=A0ABP4ADI5_9ACTN